MKIFYHPLIILCFAVFIFSKTNAQGVGINATGALPDASAMLHVDAGSSTTKGLLVTGAYNFSGTLPDLGAGSRLMFYPAKAAFRAGNVTGTQWDNSNVGLYSTALGFSTTASSSYSTAIGSSTTASGTYSTALGLTTTASGNYSTAMGTNTVASGPFSTALGSSNTATGQVSTAMGNLTTAGGGASTAMGYNTRANGANSTAMGNSTQANGINSIAMGNNAIATGNNSTAMGNFTTASGINSTAMGSFVSTNSKNGAFIIGDQFGTGASSSADNEMTMGFSGGFRLYTNSGATTGAFLPANGNAWVSVSDVNKKENFEPLDGEDVLQKISRIEFISWNYKQQDPKTYRHYGIMAQDFYKAFGHDKFGTIGNDTTVNPIDMIGIDMTAIQALEKRTADLKNENERLKASVAELQKKFTDQQKIIEQILNDTNKTHKTTTYTKQ